MQLKFFILIYFNYNYDKNVKFKTISNRFFIFFIFNFFIQFVQILFNFNMIDFVIFSTLIIYSFARSFLIFALFFLRVIFLAA